MSFYGGIVMHSACIETLTKKLETNTFKMSFAGVRSETQLVETVKKLAVKGVDVIEIFGEIDDIAVQNLSSEVGTEIKVKRIKYFSAERKALKNVNKKKYTILVKDESFCSLHNTIMLCEEIKVIGVKDLDEAITVAKAEKEQGVFLLGLCGNCDDQFTRKVICEVAPDMVVGSTDLVNEKTEFYMRKMTLKEAEKLGYKNWETYLMTGKDTPLVFEWDIEEQDTSYFLEGEAIIRIGTETHRLLPETIVMFPKGEKCTWIVPNHVKKKFILNFQVY